MSVGPPVAAVSVCRLARGGPGHAVFRFVRGDTGDDEVTLDIMVILDGGGDFAGDCTITEQQGEALRPPLAWAFDASKNEVFVEGVVGLTVGVSALPRVKSVATLFDLGRRLSDTKRVDLRDAAAALKRAKVDLDDNQKQLVDVQDRRARRADEWAAKCALLLRSKLEQARKLEFDCQLMEVPADSSSGGEEKHASIREGGIKEVRSEMRKRKAGSASDCPEDKRGEGSGALPCDSGSDTLDGLLRF